ncbi:MAG: MFS transporter, partial [Clostridia bacterium]|nr:MFS transporter [Clostridia bacterium]
SYTLCWIPVGGAERPLFNTIWATVFSIIFFASYTMCLIAFYGSFSTVCSDEPQRIRVSCYKSFFDTISYCVVYALVPVILSALKIQIDTLVFMTIPLMLTMAIPLLLIKEGEKYGYPENECIKSEKITIGESMALTFKNRIFRRWLYVNCCTYFGLQMFLASMNGLIIGGMGLNGFQMAILNTCAFGPVPVMLYFFNKAKRRYGVRATYQSCLLMFAVAIMSFFVGSRFVMGDGNVTLKLVVGIIGGVCGSWSIGAFFMMPYLAPAQISSVEEKLTGKNHSAMYFAGNAVVTSVIGAISGNLVYEYLKNIFFAKGKGFVWAEASEGLSSSEVAYKSLFGTLGTEAEIASSVFNFGNLVVPFIVVLSCVIGFFFAFKLPRDFNKAVLIREFAAIDPTVDVSLADAEEVKEERGEIVFVQIGLSVLSGFLFGFIWLGLLLRSIKELKPKFKAVVPFLMSSVIPFSAVYFNLKLREYIIEEGRALGTEIKINKGALIASSLIFPILPVNMISLGLLQSGVNRLYTAKDN